MAEMGRDEYEWRETYFILFHESQRPTLTQVERTLGELSSRFRLDNLSADEDGRLESVLVDAPDDHAALEISFEAGEAVTEQAVGLAKQLRAEADPDQLARLVRSDSRFDVMHFEHVVLDTPRDDEQGEDMLDPSCLLMVVDALVALTEGIAIDPVSGAILP